METGNFRGFEVALHDPGIALVTFNQPDRLNGMTQGMKRDLVEVLTEAQMDDAVRVIVLTGSGKAFSAGDDISGRPVGGTGAKQLVPDIGTGHRDPIGTYSALRAISQRLNWTVRDLDKLTIAAINGFAIQTGMSLALSCDFRIASEDARIGSGTLRFGLMPDEGGQYLLVQLLGVAKAMDFLMRNRIVTGKEAFELGLVHEVVPPDQLLDRAMDTRTRAGGRPAGRHAHAQALDLQRRRDVLRRRPRRHRRQDRRHRPPPRRPRRHGRLPREAQGALQRRLARIVVLAKSEPLLYFDVHDGQGPHLLLVHGFLSSRAHWLLNLDALSTFCRPVVVELLGHARSPTPEDPAPYAPVAYVAEFEAIRETIGA